MLGTYTTPQNDSAAADPHLNPKQGWGIAEWFSRSVAHCWEPIFQVRHISCTWLVAASFCSWTLHSRTFNENAMHMHAGGDGSNARGCPPTCMLRRCRFQFDQLWNHILSTSPITWLCYPPMTQM